MGITLILISLTLLLLSCFLYLKMSSLLSYWDKRGVPVPVKPKPFFGNLFQVLTRQKSFACFLIDLYAKTKSLPYIGIYSISGPSLVINDLDLTKTILTKDFIHFTDHNLKMDEQKNPILLNLFSLTGEAWKNMRVKLTPTFTTSKIKYMFKTIAECNVKMLEYLDQNLDKEKNVFDVKELFLMLNTDVIGSVAFGIECNSFVDPNSQFRKLGKKIFEAPILRSILQFIAVSLPNSLKKKLIVSRREITDFFYKLVEDTIKYREENNITKNDFMQLLINLRKTGSVDGISKNDLGSPSVYQDQDVKQVDDSGLTIMEIAAQAFVFFVAGFETSSTTSSYVLYELALNPDVQEKLREEIDEVLQKHEGIVSYEALLDMSYLSMVMDETLRKYPPVSSLIRICTKQYNIPETDIIIEKETAVFIPTIGIHRDPDIYPDPMKFDPERFTPENKSSRHNFAYLPFGEGPRACIGNRFGLVQSKLAVATVISKYQVEVCTKTLIPMEFDKTSPILTAEGGVWLRITPRKKIN